MIFIMERIIFTSLFLIIAVVTLAACGGTSEETTVTPTATSLPPPTVAPVAAPTPRPTSIPLPTLKPAVTLSESLVACLGSRLGADSAQATLSGLVTLNPQQGSALDECVLIASLESTTAASGLVACLQENLGAALAQVVVSGVIPLTESESALLGECLLTVATGGTGTEDDDGVQACLERELGTELARVVASGALPLTPEQEAIMGSCVLEDSANSTESLSNGVISCLEQELGEESASIVAGHSATLTAEQQAALGGCLVSSTLGGSAAEDAGDNAGDGQSSGVVTCLERELGVDLASVVASGVLPLSAGEEAVLGSCLLEDATSTQST